VKKKENLIVANVLLRLIHRLEVHATDLVALLEPLCTLKVEEPPVHLSRLLINKHYRIFLMDYDGVEILLHPLPKTIFILFLNHPEGIKFKELHKHRNEMLNLYNQLTNKSERKTIEAAIDSMLAPSNSSIIQKCARIREAFRKEVEVDIARYYEITGTNGYPKTIRISRDLVIREDLMEDTEEEEEVVEPV
jgi:hypothetical protein